MNIEPFARHRTSVSSPRAHREPVADTGPAHANAIEWHQSLGIARQACARIFRDGGSPADALKVFGLQPKPGADWSRTVELIAEMMASPVSRRAA